MWGDQRSVVRGTRIHYLIYILVVHNIYYMLDISNVRGIGELYGGGNALHFK